MRSSEGPLLGQPGGRGRKGGEGVPNGAALRHTVRTRLGERTAHVREKGRRGKGGGRLLHGSGLLGVWGSSSSPFLPVSPFFIW